MRYPIAILYLLLGTQLYAQSEIRCDDNRCFLVKDFESEVYYLTDSSFCEATFSPNLSRNNNIVAFDAKLLWYDTLSGTPVYNYLAVSNGTLPVNASDTSVLIRNGAVYKMGLKVPIKEYVSKTETVKIGGDPCLEYDYHKAYLESLKNDPSHTEKELKYETEQLQKLKIKCFTEVEVEELVELKTYASIDKGVFLNGKLVVFGPRLIAYYDKSNQCLVTVEGDFDLSLDILDAIAISEETVLLLTSKGIYKLAIDTTIVSVDYFTGLQQTPESFAITGNQLLLACKEGVYIGSLIDLDLASFKLLPIDYNCGQPQDDLPILKQSWSWLSWVLSIVILFLLLFAIVIYRKTKRKGHSSNKTSKRKDASVIEKLNKWQPPRWLLFAIAALSFIIFMICLSSLFFIKDKYDRFVLLPVFLSFLGFASTFFLGYTNYKRQPSGSSDGNETAPDSNSENSTSLPDV